MVTTDLTEIEWCPEHAAINVQCCGRKKEIIGHMEVIKEVPNVQDGEV